MKRLDKLQADALAVRDQHQAAAQAFADEHAAALVLLEAAVEFIRPALPLLCSRLLRRASLGGCAAHRIDPNTNDYHLDLRGVVLVPGPKGIMLSEDGSWFVDVVEPCPAQRCATWTWIPVSQVDLAEKFPVERLVIGMEHALRQQLEGSKDRRSAEAQIRAKKLAVVADLLRKV